MVQTFMVHADLEINAQLLHVKHLGKQRVEARQIIDALEAREKGEEKGYSKHTITESWIGHVPFLKYYHNIIVKEFVRRGYRNNLEYYELPLIVVEPYWWGCSEIMYSHQVNLVLKMPFHYYPLFCQVPSFITTQHSYCPNVDNISYFLQIGYIWPSRLTSEQIDDLKNGSILPHQVAYPLDDKKLTNPRYCCAIIASGQRKGQICLQILNSKQQHLCGIHSHYSQNPEKLAAAQAFSFQDIRSWMDSI